MSPLTVTIQISAPPRAGWAIIVRNGMNNSQKGRQGTGSDQEKSMVVSWESFSVGKAWEIPSHGI